MSTSCQLYSFVVDATEVQGLDSVPMTSGPSDINPVITFSDLLQLGADCTVLGTEDGELAFCFQTGHGGGLLAQA